jgi:glycosyltransferase involved in cell wall biosynthesis
MLPLTVHFPIQNDEATLPATLETLRPLNAEVVAFDTGSTDSSARICRKQGVKVVPAKSADRSAIRNSVTGMTSNPWHLALEPWETLASLGDLYKAVVGEPTAYNVQVVQGEVLSKQVRLWHTATGCRFANPVFESITRPSTDHLDLILLSDPPDQADAKLRAVEAWQKSMPAAHEPWYYRACVHLERREYDKFTSAAAQFLFLETRATQPAVMSRYYLGMVNCYIKKNAEEAIRNLLVCLGVNPLMAEFWCMLGDVYYYLLRQYDKARGFYENAKILGARRLKTDTWPLQISKYGEYPDKMLESCRAMVNGIRVLVQ